MNIFVMDSNPKLCAQWLCDLRLNKMILETAQLLSTAAHYYGAKTTYKPTHKNHPCSVWARTNYQNYNWLLCLFGNLTKEYYYRFNKEHLCCTKLFNELVHYASLLPDGKRTPFVNCSLYKDLSIFDAYRKTMIHKWNNDKRTPKWTKHNPPDWYVKES